MWYVEAGKYNVLPIDSRGTLRFADERPQIAVDRKQLRLLPGHADGAEQRRARTCSTGRTASPPTSRSRRAAPRACCCHGGDVGRLLASTSRTASCTTSTTTSASSTSTCESNAPVPEGGTSCASSSSRPASPTSPTARARPARAQLYIDGKLVGPGRHPGDHAAVHRAWPAASSAAPTPGSPVSDKYKPPFAFTGTLHGVTVDVSGELIKDTDAEMRMAMARQ